jgi:hypothetical protein
MLLAADIMSTTGCAGLLVARLVALMVLGLAIRHPLESWLARRTLRRA